uniref:Uncharacterized protein n=1 Tax=Anguilla anguilla TaxID=7936 RepID=A0A0E9Y0U6_ANGAN
MIEMTSHVKVFLLKGIPVNVDQTVSSKLSKLHDKNISHV